MRNIEARTRQVLPGDQPDTHNNPFRHTGTAMTTVTRAAVSPIRCLNLARKTEDGIFTALSHSNNVLGDLALLYMNAWRACLGVTFHVLHERPRSFTWIEPDNGTAPSSLAQLPAIR